MDSMSLTICSSRTLLHARVPVRNALRWVCVTLRRPSVWLFSYAIVDNFFCVLHVPLTEYAGNTPIDTVRSERCKGWMRGERRVVPWMHEASVGSPGHGC
jgi:hypothetical protein